MSQAKRKLSHELMSFSSKLHHYTTTVFVYEFSSAKIRSAEGLPEYQRQNPTKFRCRQDNFRLIPIPLEHFFPSLMW